MNACKPAIFLDRDGTLNAQVVREGKPYPPQSVEEFRLLDGVAAACRDLKAAGFLLVVVTNQPDVGRGDQSCTVVEAMHIKLQLLVPEIDRIEVCYDSGRGDFSRRRKPEIGMLEDASDALNIDLTSSWIIGDRWRDIDCGKKAGIKTIFIDYGYVEELRYQSDFTVKSLAEAAQIIIVQTNISKAAKN
ncbi:MAG: D,D-heptose 1,7-bisphosphate phosphatase [Verrucomicrobia bacterium RIFCSPHIGHO2_12_FULL_41_10]|nr:MAG: D,D-heptose 1,7-bisphosphate phosphatase [Verrucomicrobia bacterium RIFCSPHIGHO2_12_FULL_41_10]